MVDMETRASSIVAVFTLGCFAAVALDRRKFAAAGLLFILMAFLLANHSLGKLSDGGSEVWLKPLVCTVFCAYVLCHLVTRPTRNRNEVEDAPEASNRDRENMPHAA